MLLINNTTENHRRTFGIYKIVNTVTNEYYIGSTNTNFRARWSNHVKFMKQGKSVNILLQNDVLKYGLDAFEFIVYEICDNAETVRIREGELIFKEKPYYNFNAPMKLEKSNKAFTNFNKKFTDEHKQKLSEKAALYKHKDNPEFYKHQISINKEGSSKLHVKNIVTNVDHGLLSVIDMKNLISCSNSCKVTKLKDGESIIYGNTWYVKRISSQRKKVTVIHNDVEIVFNSFEKCDKFINKWRGFTSTHYLKGKSECYVNDYKLIFA